MIFQHHLQSCGQVWNFGTSQPQHRGVESNGTQGWERRQNRQDMESRPTMQLWHSPASTRALEEFSCRTCQLIQNQPRNSKLFSNVFVYMFVYNCSCHMLSHIKQFVGVEHSSVCSLHSAAPRYLGTLLLTSVPSQLLTVAKISSNLLATNVEWIWMNDNESNSIAMLPALLGYIPNLSQPNSLTFWTCRFVSAFRASPNPWFLALGRCDWPNPKAMPQSLRVQLQPHCDHLGKSKTVVSSILLSAKTSMFFTLFWFYRKL